MTNSTQNTFRTVSDCRVKTSAGEASFFFLSEGRILELDNQLGGRWLKIPEGSTVTLCASYDKTDTFMLAVTMRRTQDGPRVMNGIVLRKMAWANLRAVAPQTDEVIEDVIEDVAVNG